jgi:hypothetical protein
MAVAALQNTAPVAAQQVAAAPEKTYLQRMTESLDPQRIQAEEDIASRWSFAAKATAVFFSVLSLGGVIATAVLFSHLIVPVTLGAVGLLGCAAIASHLLQNEADEILEQVAEPKAISAHLPAFSEPQQIQQYLAQNGIGNQRPEDLLRLKPVIAYHQYQHTLFEKHTRQAQENCQKANRIAAETAAKPEPNLELQKDLLNATFNRICSDCQESLALQAKMKMAFITAAIVRPNYTGDLETIGMDFNLNFFHIGNPANHIFIFKNRNLAPITVAELRQMRVAELGQRFAAAMA